MLARALSTVRAGARPLSTAVLPDKPPIALFGIAGRYASAIYSAAAKKGELAQVDEDLKAFSMAMASSPAVASFVTNPGIPRGQKAKTLMEIMDEMGACGTTKKAMATLAEGGRTGEMKKVLELFNSLMVAAKGEVTAYVTTSHDVDESGKAIIEASMQEFLSAGQTVNVVYKTDPGLISGHTIEMGDKYIDYSTATQLKKLSALLGVNH